MRICFTVSSLSSRAFLAALLFILIPVLITATTVCISADSASAADLAVYSDGLAAGWEDWSWDTSLNFLNSSPVFSGSDSLSVTYIAAWGGLYLSSTVGITGTDYDTLAFWINGGNRSGQKLRVMLADGNHNLVGTGVAVQAGAGWTQVTIALADLGSPALIRGIAWQDDTGGAQPTLYLDQITLTKTAGPPTPQSGTGPDLLIDAGSGRHPISEGIYGMNFADAGLAAELRLPVNRWGGNRTTRYNWQNDTANHDRDWFYESIPEDNSNPALLPKGSAADRFVEQNRGTNTRSLVTVPLIGWLPKARAVSCGFSVAKYGAQQAADPWEPDCGNGVRQDGSLITNNDPSDTSVQVGPGFAAAWVSHLSANYGAAAGGGVSYYSLDNEPMLWHKTHRDVHPQPVSYDEIRDRTYQYASAIKTADPTAETLGPTVYGWCAYFYSAVDGCSKGTDYKTHANTPFVEWYLQQMRAYQDQNGVRILDYLDLHYYPQAANVALSPAGDAATQALRLRSTRSLWDPAYADESWINGTVNLIPRMRQWVDTDYPGTKLALTEYNWGGLESINGALAEADVLGIFGREGLDLATLWDPPSAADPGAYAFRMYRNYDGAGHGFGDESVQASSGDQDKLAIYASRRSADSALTLIVINKTGTDLTSAVSLAGVPSGSTAAVYSYSGAAPAAILRTADLQITGGGFTAMFPAESITLYVIAAGTVADRTLMITKTGTGTGSVAANTGAIAWSGNTGTAAYAASTAVTLTASPATGSVFSGWTGCNAAAGAQCSVLMDASKAVTAAFSLSPVSSSCSNGILDGNETGVDCGGSCAPCACAGTDSAMVLGIGYSTIQAACEAAPADALVKARAESTAEAVVFDRPMSATLRGGLDCAFTTITGMTTVSALTVSEGSLTVENITIGP